MKVNFKEQYDELTYKNRIKFRRHIIEVFGWSSGNASFNNLINGKTSISKIEKEYIESLFQQYYAEQIETITA